MPTFSPAVEAARQRRVGAAEQRLVRIEWFIENVTDKVKLSLKQRVSLATSMLLDRMIRNVSVPVTKVPGTKTGRIIVTERSKPGEFPRADTTQLMKTLFKEVVVDQDGASGYVGTPLDYGLFLEIKMNRSFMVRTLNEERGMITRILTGPIQ
jgi:hypothetical protein